MEEGELGASKWTVLAIVAVGVFMATLDSSIVNISLPAIARHFVRPLGAAVEWVVIAYLVVIAALLLTVGRLADMIGQKPVWAGGLILFTVGSALCGSAPALPLLIGFRALQGVGGAMIMAISPAMLTAAFPASERGRAIGMNAMAVALGVSAGPTLGGIITEHLSWRWIFFVNLPVGVAGVVATLKLLRGEPRRRPGRFDPAGAALLAVGLAALTGGLSMGGEVGWRSGAALGAAAVAIAALVAFLLVERRSAHPLLDLRLFRDRVFASATASLVLSFLAMFAIGFMMPFYLEELRGFSTEEAGLLLTPLPLALAVTAPLAGAVADRIGTRLLTATGLAICCVALVLIGALHAASSRADIIWRLALAGVGQGLFQTPNNSALLGAAPRSQQGVASGILATGRVVGQSLSVALAGAVFGSFGGPLAGRALATESLPPDAARALGHAFETAFRATLSVCAAVAAIGIITSLTRGAERRK